MALSATITWEVRYTGSDTNGGGFKTGASGTDYTLQDSPQLTVTDAACSGTTTVTSATGGFTSAMIGNVMYLSSGPGWYEITARTNTNTVTIDRAGPNATGMTCNVGGAFATPGQAGGVKVAGNDIYIKYNASSYTLTSSTANVSGGKISDTTGGGWTNASNWVGYDTTRTIDNTDANRPTISAGAISSITIFNQGADYTNIRNLIFDGNNQTATIGAATDNSYGNWRRCKAVNCTSYGFRVNGFNCNYLMFCEATGNSGVGFSSATGSFYYYCESYGNTASGFDCSNGDHLVFCISSGNTGASSDGFSSNSVGYNAFNCVAYGNGRNGFDVDNSVAATLLVNCIAYNNSSSGFYASGVKVSAFLKNCAGGSNVSGNYNSTNLPHVSGFVDLSTNDPFTNAASGDFSLNNTAGAGALLRAAGFPGVMPRGTTTGYLDIGVAQHADPASSGISNRVIQATNIGTY